MRKRWLVAAAAGLFAVTAAALIDQDGARQFVRGYVAPAKAAYVLLEEDPLGSGNFERAAGLIQQARQREAQHAWVYVALAKATLVYGYQQGSRYEAGSFLPEAVDRARAFSNRAVELGPEQSFAHSFRGRIALMEREHEQAHRWLDRAQALDPHSFYPHYFRSVLYRQAGHLEQARRALHEASERRERRYQARWIMQARRDIAAAAGDRERTEALHRRILDRFPGSGEARAQYGRFLMREERYGEAVAQFEKALELAPLAPVRSRLEAARESRSNHARTMEADAQ